MVGGRVHGYSGKAAMKSGASQRGKTGIISRGFWIICLMYVAARATVDERSDNILEQNYVIKTELDTHFIQPAFQSIQQYVRDVIDVRV
jgi:hypothetical protein